MTLELVDKTGERKFVKTKLMTIGNTFLTDKGSYYLAKVNQQLQGMLSARILHYCN